MKEILLFTLGLLVAITSLGQDLLVTDSTQGMERDPVSTRNTEFSGSKLEDATKSKGNGAYIKNGFTSAIQTHGSLLCKGNAADAYYNLENSYYKVNEIAKAILNYERTLSLQPGNGDTCANLEIAHGKTIDKVEAVPEVFFMTWTKALINSMGIDAWAVWGIVGFLSLVVSLHFLIFSKQIVLKKVGSTTGIVFLIAVVTTNVLASKQKEELLYRDSATMMNPSVTVRSAPSESGTSLLTLHEGHEVDTKDSSMEGWKEIRPEDGEAGWVPINSTEVI